MRFNSSSRSGPFSVSHRSCVAGSTHSPNEFRWPSDHTGESGLEVLPDHDEQVAAAEHEIAAVVQVRQWKQGQEVLAAFGAIAGGAESNEMVPAVERARVVHV